MAAENHNAFDFAALARAAVAPDRLPPPPAPVGASPAVAAAWGDYFRAKSTADGDDASDAVTDIACEEMTAAARRLSAVPCRSLADLAAKTLFVIRAMEETGELTEAEGEVLASVATDALAMAGGVA